MKTAVATHLAHFLEDKQLRRNLKSLLKYLALVAAVVLLYTFLFHILMIYVEGERHSIISGFYWTLTVMSTLGFGDITFQTDLGRAFSMLVLLSGIIMLLVVLPFAFIRYFYAPWLEAQIRMHAPREAQEEVEGHVIICNYDSVAPGLIRRLEQDKIPYYLIESDPQQASDFHIHDISVVQGDVDARETYEALRAHRARMIIANASDTINTNIILTVREMSPEVPITAIANLQESIDVLELSGATNVLPLKKWLGDQLANRVSAAHTQSHVIGRYENLAVAELPAHFTPLAGKTIRETNLRPATGVTVLGLWQRGTLVLARPDMPITNHSVLVVIGSEQQLSALDDLLAIYDINPNPVLVVGGGRVGRSVAQALNGKDVPVNLVEREQQLCQRVADLCNETFCGDAADYQLLQQAGIQEAPSVVLTTNDDAMNIYLASYCRRLNPDLRIVSRITHERNLEAIHRAGADFALSSSSLGVDTLFSMLKGKEFIMLGEGVDLFPLSVPDSLNNKTLAESDIGARTGLNVVALRTDGQTNTQIGPNTSLKKGVELLVVGHPDQREAFLNTYS